MAFDFSRSWPEESLFSSYMFFDYATPKDWDGFDPFGADHRCSSCSSNPEMGKSGDHGRVDDDDDDKDDDDIADQLPADPFDMEIRSTFTAITGWNWIADLEEDFGVDFDIMDEDEVGDHGLISELNWVWNESSGYMKIDSFTGFLIDDEYNCEVVDEGTVKKILGFGFEGHRGVADAGCIRDGAGGDPHDALEFALHYMAVKELLSLERVCRSLHNKIKSDCLLWRSIHIDWPLSGRINDDSLLQITSKAQGALECLILVECRRITDRGIKRVLETNPKLTKLSVPGCTRLTIEGITFNLRSFKSTGAPGIKHLRIGEISTVTDQQFEEINFLLGTDDKHKHKRAHKPQFYQLYRAKKLNLSDDDRSIDIEKCPRCEGLKLVYDCPVESCQKKVPSCRACLNCIGRCIHCGRCIKDCDYEETFCLDLLCLDCWKKFLKLQEAPEENGASSSKRAIFHQEMKYRFHLYS